MTGTRGFLADRNHFGKFGEAAGEAIVRQYTPQFRTWYASYLTRLAFASGGYSVAPATNRVVSQLLTELDGLEQLEDVVVIATTNRPDLIDNALLRPGRLDRHVHVPVPDEDARKAIFEVHTRDKPLAEGIDMEWLASQTEGFVGADIEAVTREASMAASREFINSVEPEGIEESVGNVRITREHFEQALDEVGPSVTDDVRERYEELESELTRTEPDSEQLGRTFQ